MDLKEENRIRNERSAKIAERITRNAEELLKFQEWYNKRWRNAAVETERVIIASSSQTNDTQHNDTSICESENSNREKIQRELTFNDFWRNVPGGGITIYSCSESKPKSTKSDLQLNWQSANNAGNFFEEDYQEMPCTLSLASISSKNSSDSHLNNCIFLVGATVDDKPHISSPFNDYTICQTPVGSVLCNKNSPTERVASYYEPIEGDLNSVKAYVMHRLNCQDPNCPYQQPPEQGRSPFQCYIDGLIEKELRRAAAIREVKEAFTFFTDQRSEARNSIELQQQINAADCKISQKWHQYLVACKIRRQFDTQDDVQQWRIREVGEEMAKPKDVANEQCIEDANKNEGCEEDQVQECECVENECDCVKRECVEHECQEESCDVEECESQCLPRNFVPATCVPCYDKSTEYTRMKCLCAMGEQASCDSAPQYPLLSTLDHLIQMLKKSGLCEECKHLNKAVKKCENVTVDNSNETAANSSTSNSAPENPWRNSTQVLLEASKLRQKAGESNSNSLEKLSAVEESSATKASDVNNEQLQLISTDCCKPQEPTPRGSFEQRVRTFVESSCPVCLDTRKSYTICQEVQLDCGADNTNKSADKTNKSAGKDSAAGPPVKELYNNFTFKPKNIAKYSKSSTNENRFGVSKGPSSTREIKVTELPKPPMQAQAQKTIQNGHRSQKPAESLVTATEAHQTKETGIKVKSNNNQATPMLPSSEAQRANKNAMKNQGPKRLTSTSLTTLNTKQAENGRARDHRTGNQPRLLLTAKDAQQAKTSPRTTHNRRSEEPVELLHVARETQPMEKMSTKVQRSNNAPRPLSTTTEAQKVTRPRNSADPVERTVERTSNKTQRPAPITQAAQQAEITTRGLRRSENLPGQSLKTGKSEQAEKTVMEDQRSKERANSLLAAWEVQQTERTSAEAARLIREAEEQQKRIDAERAAKPTRSPLKKNTEEQETENIVESQPKEQLAIEVENLPAHTNSKRATEDAVRSSQDIDNEELEVEVRLTRYSSTAPVNNIPDNQNAQNSQSPSNPENLQSLPRPQSPQTLLNPQGPAIPSYPRITNQNAVNPPLSDFPKLPPLAYFCCCSKSSPNLPARSCYFQREKWQECLDKTTRARNANLTNATKFTPCPCPNILYPQQLATTSVQEQKEQVGSAKCNCTACVSNRMQYQAATLPSLQQRQQERVCEPCDCQKDQIEAVNASYPFLNETDLENVSTSIACEPCDFDGQLLASPKFCNMAESCPFQNNLSLNTNQEAKQETNMSSTAQRLEDSEPYQTTLTKCCYIVRAPKQTQARTASPDAKVFESNFSAREPCDCHEAALQPTQCCCKPDEQIYEGRQPAINANSTAREQNLQDELQENQAQAPKASPETTQGYNEAQHQRLLAAAERILESHNDQVQTSCKIRCDCGPVAPKNTTILEACRILKEHLQSCQKELSDIFQQHQCCCNQSSNESIEENLVPQQLSSIESQVRSWNNDTQEYGSNESLKSQDVDGSLSLVASSQQFEDKTLPNQMFAQEEQIETVARKSLQPLEVLDKSSLLIATEEKLQSKNYITPPAMEVFTETRSTNTSNACCCTCGGLAGVRPTSHAQVDEISSFTRSLMYVPCPNIPNLKQLMSRLSATANQQQINFNTRTRAQGNLRQEQIQQGYNASLRNNLRDSHDRPNRRSYDHANERLYKHQNHRAYDHANYHPYNRPNNRRYECTNENPNSHLLRPTYCCCDTTDDSNQNVNMLMVNPQQCNSNSSPYDSQCEESDQTAPYGDNKFGTAGKMQCFCTNTNSTQYRPASMYENREIQPQGNMRDSAREQWCSNLARSESFYNCTCLSPKVTDSSSANMQFLMPVCCCSDDTCPQNQIQQTTAKGSNKRSMTYDQLEACRSNTCRIGIAGGMERPQNVQEQNMYTFARESMGAPYQQVQSPQSCCNCRSTSANQAGRTSLNGSARVQPQSNINSTANDQRTTIQSGQYQFSRPRNQDQTPMSMARDSYDLAAQVPVSSQCCCNAQNTNRNMQQQTIANSMRQINQQSYDLLKQQLQFMKSRRSNGSSGTSEPQGFRNSITQASYASDTQSVPQAAYANSILSVPPQEFPSNTATATPQVYAGNAPSVPVQVFASSTPNAPLPTHTFSPRLCGSNGHEQQSATNEAYKSLETQLQLIKNCCNQQQRPTNTQRGSISSATTRESHNIPENHAPWSGMIYNQYQNLSSKAAANNPQQCDGSSNNFNWNIQELQSFSYPHIGPIGSNNIPSNAFCGGNLPPLSMQQGLIGNESPNERMQQEQLIYGQYQRASSNGEVFERNMASFNAYPYNNSVRNQRRSSQQSGERQHDQYQQGACFCRENQGQEKKTYTHLDPRNRLERRFSSRGCQQLMKNQTDVSAAGKSKAQYANYAYMPIKNNGLQNDQMNCSPGPQATGSYSNYSSQTGAVNMQNTDNVEESAPNGAQIVVCTDALQKFQASVRESSRNSADPLATATYEAIDAFSCVMAKGAVATESQKECSESNKNTKAAESKCDKKSAAESEKDQATSATNSTPKQKELQQVVTALSSSDSVKTASTNHSNTNSSLQISRSESGAEACDEDSDAQTKNECPKNTVDDGTCQQKTSEEGTHENVLPKQSLEMVVEYDLNSNEYILRPHMKSVLPRKDAQNQTMKSNAKTLDPITTKYPSYSCARQKLLPSQTKPPTSAAFQYCSSSGKPCISSQRAQPNYETRQLYLAKNLAAKIQPNPRQENEVATTCKQSSEPSQHIRNTGQKFQPPCQYCRMSSKNNVPRQLKVTTETKQFYSARTAGGNTESYMTHPFQSHCCAYCIRSTGANRGTGNQRAASSVSPFQHPYCCTNCIQNHFYTCPYASTRNPHPHWCNACQSRSVAAQQAESSQGTYIVGQNKSNTMQLKQLLLAAQRRNQNSNNAELETDKNVEEMGQEEEESVGAKERVGADESVGAEESAESLKSVGSVESEESEESDGSVESGESATEKLAEEHQQNSKPTQGVNKQVLSAVPPSEKELCTASAESLSKPNSNFNENENASPTPNSTEDLHLLTQAKLMKLINSEEFMTLFEELQRKQALKELLEKKSFRYPFRINKAFVCRRNHALLAPYRLSRKKKNDLLAEVEAEIEAEYVDDARVGAETETGTEIDTAADASSVLGASAETITDQESTITPKKRKRRTKRNTLRKTVSMRDQFTQVEPMPEEELTELNDLNHQSRTERLLQLVENLAAGSDDDFNANKEKYISNLHLLSATPIIFDMGNEPENRNQQIRRGLKPIFLKAHSMLSMEKCQQPLTPNDSDVDA